MHFALLADHPEAIPQIAAWYFDQWGRLGKFSSPGELEDYLQGSLNRDEIPLLVLALENEEITGVAELKYHEMDIYPEKEHWLGGIYVPAKHRGKRIASQLVQHALLTARALGISKLHLQTEQLDGGLYASLGWVPVDQVTYRGVDVLVMERDLDD